MWGWVNCSPLGGSNSMQRFAALIRPRFRTKWLEIILIFRTMSADSAWIPRWSSRLLFSGNVLLSTIDFRPSMPVYLCCHGFWSFLDGNCIQVACCTCLISCVINDWLYDVLWRSQYICNPFFFVSSSWLISKVAQYSIGGRLWNSVDNSIGGDNFCSSILF